MAADHMQRRHQPEAARALLEPVSTVGLPPPLAHDLAQLQFDLGSPSRAKQTVESALERSPHDMALWFAAMALRVGLKDMKGAIAAADQLVHAPLECHAMQREVRRWQAAPDLPPGHDADLARLLAVRCPGDGKCGAN